MPESEVSKDVRKVLDLFEYHKVVLWWERLNVGKIQYFGRWIHLCKPGTSDYIALIRNRAKGLSVLFIECKREDGKNTLGEDQEKFRDKYKDQKDVYYLEVLDAKKLKEFISGIGVDDTEALDAAFNGII